MAKYSRLSPKILNNLRALARAAMPTGQDWYHVANATCKGIFAQYSDAIPSLTLDGTIAIVAVLSPGQQWERNISSAEIFLQAFAEGKRGPELPAGCSPYGFRNLMKSEALAFGQDPIEVLSGPKVTAFYHCISDPASPDYVVIDRHARTAALALPKTKENGIVKSEGEYRWLSAHYVRGAREFGLTPSAFQAIIWEYWRTL